MTAINDLVSYEAKGTVGVVTVNSPPVNALSQGVRAGILGGIQAGIANASVSAIVLTCAGRTFIAGADITEFGKPPREPSLKEVIDTMEASTKPVIAAIHGTALGGGLETALGCHYRVAVASAKVGLPEVKLGLLPGAGGTQRLPRVVGVPIALDLITSGEHVPAPKAHKLGLIDAVEGGDDIRQVGLAYARKLAAEGAPVRRVRDISDKVEADKGSDVFDQFRAGLAKKARGLFSPFKCVDAVEAAFTLPFAEGLKRERELFKECMESPQRAGLIHSFFAEREVSKVKGLAKDT